MKKFAFVAFLILCTVSAFAQKPIGFGGGIGFDLTSHLPKGFGILAVLNVDNYFVC